jgi:choline dehydrogenase
LSFNKKVGKAMADMTFDYIIVGAGAAGCVLANRLSADPDVKVLVLEAGPLDNDARIADIGAVTQLWGSELDQSVATTEQAGLAGRQIVIHQGHVLGGSTSIHAKMYVRGNRRNYDLWAALGNDGWDFDSLLPHFKRLEDYTGGASEYHGVGGPLAVCDNPEAASRSAEFMAAAQEMGYDAYCDINGARQEDGAGFLQFTIDAQGNRASASSAFLHPITARANLTVLADALMRRLAIEQGRVTGVYYQHDGQMKHARANREVILSAGAFHSPKLLMLSGIGPADHLQDVGIDVVVDLPGVGQNLQDHLQLPVAFRSKVDAPAPNLLTGNVLFLQTRDKTSTVAAPDLQLNFTPSVPQPLRSVIDLGGPGFIFLPILIQPFSVGELHLQSANPDEFLQVDPRYLSQQSDVEVFKRAIALIREMVSTTAFGEINGGELAPGADVTDDAALEQFIRAQATTLWHPAGTCKMGRDALAVVDPQLRVYGVEGLRVVDASVMPQVTSGNTQAPCFVIAEKAAEMIRQA